MVNKSLPALPKGFSSSRGGRPDAEEFARRVCESIATYCQHIKTIEKVEPATLVATDSCGEIVFTCDLTALIPSITGDCVDLSDPLNIIINAPKVEGDFVSYDEQSKTYTVGSLSAAMLCEMLEAECPHLRTVTYNNNGELVFTNTAGVVTTIPLSSTVVDNQDGTFTFTQTDGSMARVLGQETITSLTVNPDGSATYINEAGALSTIPAPTFSRMQRLGQFLTHTAGDGIETVFDICDMVRNCAPTLTPGPLTNQYTFDDGFGNQTVIDVNELDMDVNGISVGGSIINFTTENGTTGQIDICAIVAANCNATMTGNADGSINFNDNAGNDFTIPAQTPETVTTLVVNPDGSLTYVNEQGTTTNVPAQAPETLTTMVANPDGSYTYTSENGSITTIAAENVTTLTQNANGSFTYVNELGAATVIPAAMVATLVENAGVLTFDNGNGTPVNFDLCAIIGANCPDSMVVNPDGSLTHTSINGTVVNVPAAVGETVTTLTQNPDGSFTYVNELGAVTNIPASAMETVTTLTLNPDGSVTYVSENGALTTVPAPLVSTLVENAGVLQFDNGSGVPVNFDICAIVEANCEDSLVVNADGSVTHTSIGGDVSIIPAPAADIVTTLTANPDGSYTYVNEVGTPTTLPAAAISMLTVNTNGTVTHDDGRGNTTQLQAPLNDSASDQIGTDGVSLNPLLDCDGNAINFLSDLIAKKIIGCDGQPWPGDGLGNQLAQDQIPRGHLDVFSLNEWNAVGDNVSIRFNFTNTGQVAIAAVDGLAITGAGAAIFDPADFPVMPGDTIQTRVEYFIQPDNVMFSDISSQPVGIITDVNGKIAYVTGNYESHSTAPSSSTYVATQAGNDFFGTPYSIGAALIETADGRITCIPNKPTPVTADAVDANRGFDLPGAIAYSVADNDVACSAGTTTYALIAGTETNVSAVVIDPNTGAYTANVTSGGAWSFEYQILCDGIFIDTAFEMGQGITANANDFDRGDDMPGAIAYSVADNDVACSDGVTTYALVAGSESNVTGVVITAATGAYTANVTAVGAWSFMYNILCDGQVIDTASEFGTGVAAPVTADAVDQDRGDSPAGAIAFNVSDNDTACSAGVTTYALVAGSETNVSSVSITAATGAYTANVDGAGAWEFEYNILCDGVVIDTAREFGNGITADAVNQNRGVETVGAIAHDVSENDVACSSGVTTYQLIGGTEANVTGVVINAATGAYTANIAAAGAWSFEYDILCDGVVFDSAAESGTGQAVAVTADAVDQDRGREAAGPIAHDVSDNDTACSSGVTTYELVAGSEVNVTAVAINAATGAYTANVSGNGDWEFEYNILCDGVVIDTAREFGEGCVEFDQTFTGAELFAGITLPDGTDINFIGSPPQTGPTLVVPVLQSPNVDGTEIHMQTLTDNDGSPRPITQQITASNPYQFQVFFRSLNGFPGIPIGPLGGVANVGEQNDYEQIVNITPAPVAVNPGATGTWDGTTLQSENGNDTADVTYPETTSASFTYNSEQTWYGGDPVPGVLASDFHGDNLYISSIRVFKEC